MEAFVIRIPLSIRTMGPLINTASYALRHPKDFLSSVGPTLNELTFGTVGSLFNPQRDIGDLDGKVIFVTGGKAIPPEDHLGGGANKIPTYR